MDDCGSESRTVPRSLDWDFGLDLGFLVSFVLGVLRFYFRYRRSKKIFNFSKKLQM